MFVQVPNAVTRTVYCMSIPSGLLQCTDYPSTHSSPTLRTLAGRNQAANLGTSGPGQRPRKSFRHHRNHANLL